MNTKLQNAKKEKNDEFYTQLVDIENELKHYKKHFENKIVYCNCDDPEWSNFYKYFKMNFETLKLKKVITTHYSKNIESDKSYKLEFDGKTEVKTTLESNGDFRSEECLDLLSVSDIVVTNPPFSLFREYIENLISNNKSFLVIGNNNALTYKEIFNLIKQNKLWLGFHTNKTMEFALDNSYQKWNRTDDKGKKYGNVPSISWFTNLSHSKRNEEMILYKTYRNNEDYYPKYENYDAINVNNIKDIPIDYFDEIGVPITFMSKFNPNQFELLGIDRVLVFQKSGKVSRFKIDNKELYARIIIKRKV